jgi:p-hydroxybenzoate 3-monooxygenase
MSQTPPPAGHGAQAAAARSQIVIVGGGPAGLMLAHLLHLSGIDSVVLERESEEHVVGRVRAGVLEQGTVDLLREAGVGARLDREGLRHRGIYVAFDGVRHHIDFDRRTERRGITIYGQNEVVRDLLSARETAGRPPLFGVSGVRLHGLTSSQPRVTFHDAGGAPWEITCDFVAGCDGFHGVSRASVPAGVARVFERVYPFAWLGVLAEAPPSSPELVYSLHDRGFALFSMRSPSVTRLYLQVAPDTDIGAWTDDRIWSELRARLGTADGWRPNEGRITQKNITGMRSFMFEPLRYGRLFLAGDAAHIVPPTGAKGLNLAMADVKRLADAFAAFYGSGRHDGLETYSDRGLRRAWRAQRFSWWMTSTLHIAADATPFDRRRQIADLDYLVSSEAAMTSLAESYVGTPFD